MRFKLIYLQGSATEFIIAGGAFGMVAVQAGLMHQYVAGIILCLCGLVCLGRAFLLSSYVKIGKHEFGRKGLAVVVDHLGPNPMGYKEQDK